MSITQFIADMDLRFTSGNSVPVQRAHIDAKEWAELRRMLNLFLRHGIPEEKQ